MMFSLSSPSQDAANTRLNPPSALLLRRANPAQCPAPSVRAEGPDPPKRLTGQGYKGRIDGIALTV